jgi:hypothetical protein
LAPLRESTVCVFGAGCVGAPIILELARAGVKEIRMVDPDHVDPATVSRWPLGFQSVGLHKVGALAREISLNYPFVEVKGYAYYVGAVRNPDDPGRTLRSVMEELTAGASLMIDATAEIGVQQYLADYASEAGLSYIGVHATPGGWGGSIVRLKRETRGCWICYQLALRDGKITEPPKRQDDQIQPVGCADPTFTGAGFDMLQIAIPAVRLAVSTLCGAANGGYPATNWDVMTIALRSEDGTLSTPTFDTFVLEDHPECTRCHPT